jgi:hypothetical protein
MASDSELDRKSLAVARIIGDIAFNASHVTELTIFPLEVRSTLKKMGFPKCAHPNQIQGPTPVDNPISDFMRGNQAPILPERTRRECVFCGARNEGGGWKDGSVNFPIQWDYLPSHSNPLLALERALDLLGEHQSNGTDRP